VVERRRDSFDGLSRYYLSTTARAMNVIAPYETNRRPAVAEPELELPSFADPDAARQWLAAERENLMAIAARNVTDRTPEYVVQLSLLMFRFLDSQALYDEATKLHSTAEGILRERGDDRLALILRHLGTTQERMGRLQDAAATMAEALALTRRTGADEVIGCYIMNSLGLIYYRIGRNAEAIELLTEAISVAERLTDDELLGTALRNISVAYWRVGQYREASATVKRANDIAGQLGDDTLFGFTLTNLGLTYWRAGRHDEALQSQFDALRAARRAKSELVSGYAITNQGLIRWRMGEYPAARELQEQAMVIANRINHLSLRAYVLMNLGIACWTTGETPLALDLLTQSVALARRIGDTGVLAEAANYLGEVSRSAGHLDVARRSHDMALKVSEATGDRMEQAKAWEGIGLCLIDRSELTSAHDALGQASAIYAQLPDPRAAIVDEIALGLTGGPAPTDPSAPEGCQGLGS